MSSLQVQLIPIFKDNYIFLINYQNKVIIVDPGSSTEVEKFLIKNKLQVSAIFITHHHADHIGGLTQLVEFLNHHQEASIKVYAPQLNAAQIPNATNYVLGGELLEIESQIWQVMQVAGHTLGHVAFFNAESKSLFSGDVVFGLGCGRLFEGSAEQMWTSLNKIKSLPLDTKIFCTHEYTELNLNFCDALLENKNELVNFSHAKLQRYAERLRSQRNTGKPSVPLLLEHELDCNPFLLTQTVDEFAALRLLRNEF